MVKGKLWGKLIQYSLSSIILSLFDQLTTLLAASKYGLVWEANPWMLAQLSDPVPSQMLLTALLFGLCCGLLSHAFEKVKVGFGLFMGWWFCLKTSCFPGRNARGKIL